MLKSQRAVIHICGGQMWGRLSTGCEAVVAARGASTWQPVAPRRTTSDFAHSKH